MEKIDLASRQTGIRTIAIAGGVSANSALRKAVLDKREESGWDVFIPRFEYSTDNAAMIAITGYFKYLRKEYASPETAPYSRSLKL
jgi:N6-L-threonylcarbamoyladenine synthase